MTMLCSKIFIYIIHLQKRHWICSSTRTLRSSWKRWSHNWRGTSQTKCPASSTGSSTRSPTTTGLWTRRYTHRHIHTYLQFVFFIYTTRLYTRWISVFNISRRVVLYPSLIFNPVSTFNRYSCIMLLYQMLVF